MGNGGRGGDGNERTGKGRILDKTRRRVGVLERRQEERERTNAFEVDP